MSKSHSQSILQTEKKCFITGQTEGLHKHHIFYGTGNRQVSEENGFWVWLSPEWHNMSDHGVHFDKDFDEYLKVLCQQRFEETHTRDEFMKLIGRNYLEYEVE